MTSSSSFSDSSTTNSHFVSREVVGIGEDLSTSHTDSFLKENAMEKVSFPSSLVVPPTRTMVAI